MKILCHLAYNTLDPTCMILFICKRLDSKEWGSSQRKNADISQSAQNKRIRRIYMLEGEICTQDKNIFGIELEILLKSRFSKKRRFLEWADFLVAASRIFVATGQTTLRTYFLSTKPLGPNNHGILQKHTEEEPRIQPSENIQVTYPSIHLAVSRNQKQIQIFFFQDSSYTREWPPKLTIHCPIWLGHGVQWIQSCS